MRQKRSAKKGKEQKTQFPMRRSASYRITKLDRTGKRHLLCTPNTDCYCMPPPLPLGFGSGGNQGHSVHPLPSLSGSGAALWRAAFFTEMGIKVVAEVSMNHVHIEAARSTRGYVLLSATADMDVDMVHYVVLTPRDESADNHPLNCNIEKLGQPL